MNERTFKLPGIQELSKEQENGLRLPGKGQHLIIGGPGTGKSILALMRCRHYCTHDIDYIFLVYNHLLNQACKQLFGEDLRSHTWMRWFHSIFAKMTNASVPKMPPQSNGFRMIDWNQVQVIIAGCEPGKDLPSLIIM